ncbi:MAG: carbohydrate binding domain-containing protein [Lachnospiraceae bacterium]|nr:carbohydrate binding domain-containing protein [Lachnospiraceae bacterium]
MRVFKKNICKRICVIMLSATLALSGGLSGIKADAAKKAIKSVSVTNVDGKKFVLKKGQKFKLKTKVVKNDKNAKTTLKITSSNKKVVKVTKKGELKAVKNGKATITVKSTATPSKYVKIKVTVGTPVKSVNVSKTSINGTVGEVVSLGASVTPKNASVKTLKYTTANKKVATVDSKGKVKLVGVGTTTVTAISTDGHAKKKIVKVTVKKAEETVEPTTPTPSVEPTTPTSSTDPTAVTPSVEPAKPTPSVDPAPTPNPTPNPSDDPVGPAPDPEPVMSEASTLDRTGYELEWSEEFDGEELDTEEKWTVETHEAGWVNEELQEYVDSDKNYYLKDDKLYIVPIKSEDGKKYTSARISTKDKQYFKYGLFEATVKVPKGKGYLPAFWMMPDEELYGQWPKCGEIDCMEVMGQDTNKLYGTIHYGEPHKETQGTASIKDGKYIETESHGDSSIDGNYVLENGKSFSDDFHTFSVEWEPDHITWYVDGIKYHEAKDWFSAVDGGGEQAYPAPFDQPFYLILNLAIGGEWVGYPDDTTTYGEESAFVVDSVKVYQKTEEGYYDQKEATAEKPAQPEVHWKEAVDGNFVTNGNFATDINSETDWTMHLESDAEGTTYNVANNSITINPSTTGEKAHSIQLKQEGLPLRRGGKYEIKYTASASAERDIVCNIKEPDRGYNVVVERTDHLTTQPKDFILEFEMEAKEDPNTTLEFNLGALDSNASVTISNVSLKLVDDSNIVDETKLHEVRSDGNFVYNGTFSEGSDRLKYWDVSEGDSDKVSVTNKDNVRKLKVVVTSADDPVSLTQTKVPFIDGDYVLSFTASKEDGTDGFSISVPEDKNFADMELSTDTQSFERKFSYPLDASEDAKEVVLNFTKPGTYYVDDIVICDDAMIKNGSFRTGKAVYECGSYKEGKASFKVIKESAERDSVLDAHITKAGNEDWHVQIKQGKVKLEKDKWYRLTFDAKATVARKASVIMQQNGGDWAAYSGANTVDLTTEWQTFPKTFQMTANTDAKTLLSIAIGKIGTENITEEHHVYFDNIVLEEVDAPDPETGDNLFGTFEYTDGSGWTHTAGDSNFSYSDGKATFTIAKADTYENPWDIATEYRGFNLEKGKDYILSFKASSDVAKSLKVGIQHDGGSYGSFCQSVITTGVEEKKYIIRFTADKDPDPNESVGNRVVFYIQMGKVNESDTAASVTISEPSLVEVLTPAEPVNLLSDSDFTNPWNNDWEAYVYSVEDVPQGSATFGNGNGTIVFDIQDVGPANYAVALKKKNLTLKKNQQYKLTFKASSSVARKIEVQFQSMVGDAWYYSEMKTLSDELNQYTITFTPAAERYSETENEKDGIYLRFALGKVTTGWNEGQPITEATSTSEITIKDIKLVEVPAES